VVVANWPATRRLHWQTLVRARAIENQAYVLAVNRVGADPNGLTYAGDTVLVDPTGAYVATAPDGEVATIVGAVDPERVADIRRRFPFLDDRRP
jgi:predicted amidohydrolase